MKILSILLRLYFLVAGVAGVLNTLFLLNDKIDWSLMVGLSMFITLFIGVSYLFFAWKFDELLPKRKYLIQSTIFVTLCNTLATSLLGVLGQNQSKSFREFDINQLIVFGVVAIIVYSVLIFLVSKVSNQKVSATSTSSSI